MLLNSLIDDRMIFAKVSNCNVSCNKPFTNNIVYVKFYKWFLDSTVVSNVLSCPPFSYALKQSSQVKEMFLASPDSQEYKAVSHGLFCLCWFSGSLHVGWVLRMRNFSMCHHYPGPCLHTHLTQIRQQYNVYAAHQLQCDCFVEVASWWSTVWSFNWKIQGHWR